MTATATAAPFTDKIVADSHVPTPDGALWSPMKDFFDIHRLAATRTFDGDTMSLAVAATFTRRGIEIPGERPLALSSEFADDAQKNVQ